MQWNERSDEPITKNEWRKIDENTIEIRLTLGKTTLIDADDFDKIRKIRWNAHDRTQRKTHYYVDSSGKTPAMHNLLSGTKPTDHINGNTLDNRKSNLRHGPPKVNNNNRAMNKNNKTGVHGINLRKSDYRFTWREPTFNGKLKGKTFSFGEKSVIDKEEALKRAIVFRDETYMRTNNNNGKRQRIE